MAIANDPQALTEARRQADAEFLAAREACRPEWLV